MLSKIPEDLGAKIKKLAIAGEVIHIPNLGKFSRINYRNKNSIVFYSENLIYDPTLSYDENFERNLPYFKESPICKNTKLGAGIAINSSYIYLFSTLGYEFITYKTVRSYEKESLSFPNILGKINGKWKLPDIIDWSNYKIEAITNSYGMPSKSPDFWINDINLAKKNLRTDQKLVLSFVGDNLENIIKTSDLADQTSADILELDASCPNDGSFIYNNLELTEKSINSLQINKPLIIKVGPWNSYEETKKFCRKIGNEVYGIEAINGIKKTGFEKLLGRSSCGVCGPEIFETSLQNIRWLSKAKKELDMSFKIFGIGGIHDEETSKKMFESGANVVGAVTAAMLDPKLPQKISKLVLLARDLYF